MKKKVCIVTSTRADYSLLKPLISKFDIALDFDLNLVVTGMHLSYEFGATYNIIEADGFKIPTVNIGDRQKGRIQAESIINCETNSSSITLAIKKSLSPEFKNTLQSIVNPYGGEDTCNKIINIITKFLNSTIDLKKTFYNINF